MDYSKITTSDNCCTIEGEDATLYYTYIRDIDKIEVEYNDGRHEEFEREECENNMVYEIKDFINMVKKGENMEHYRAVSLNTMRNNEEEIFDVDCCSCFDGWLWAKEASSCHSNRYTSKQCG